MFADTMAPGTRDSVSVGTNLLGRVTTGAAMFLLDAAALVVVWPAAVLLAGVHAPSRQVIAGLLLFPALDLLCLYALGLYRRDTMISLRRGVARLPFAACLAALAGACGLAVLGVEATSPRGLALLGAGAFLAAGVAARGGFYVLRRRGLFRRRLLVVGAGRRAWDLAWMLRREGRTLIYEITFCHDPALGALDQRLAAGGEGRVVPMPAGGALGVARRVRADQIVVAPDERRGMPLDGLLACKVAGFPVRQYLSFVETEIRRVDLKRMELGWLLYSEGFYFGVIDRSLKRALDLAVSAVLLGVLAPVLLGAMAVISIGDRGPVFYRQRRVTRNGRAFFILKLRTMRTDAEAGGAVWAAQADARITRVGAFLRRTRIDEIPQLLNVFLGDMSLVGPRPERPEFVRTLGEQLPLYNERHVVKAGLTGWAQVNYPYGASTDDARSKLSYDLYYVKNFSVLFDLLIILQTIRVVLWPGGVR